MSTTLAPSFFHTRDNPWYGVGTVIDKPVRSAEALSLAGLDWDVDVEPIYQRTDRGNFKPIEGKRAVTRSDTNDVLGIVGKNYREFQNRDAFAFADALVDDGGLVFESAGEYLGGKRVFLVAKLPDTVQVLGEDPHGLYLFLVTSHDGTLAITAVVTHLRIACTNMINLALRTAKTRWSIRHTSSAEGRILEARQALAMTYTANDAYQAEMEKLVRLSITDAELRTLMADVLPVAKRRPAKIESIVQVMNESPSIPDDYRGTRYGALQAFTEWMDWGREVRSDEARFRVSFEGYGARQRDQVYRRLVGAPA